MEPLERMLEEVRDEFPEFRLVYKDKSPLSRLIDWALRLVTFGAQRTYLEEYHTVIGSTLYVPRSWESTPDVERVIVLRHERVHLRQRRRYGLPLFAFLYLVPFFPLGLAYGRARLEWEAYAETLRATAEYYGLAAARDEALRCKMVGRFTGGAYGWMWPFRAQVQRWFDQVVAELQARQNTSESAEAAGSLGASSNESLGDPGPPTS